eukprot:5619365-Prymnesium_polylepis.2
MCTGSSAVNDEHTPWKAAKSARVAHERCRANYTIREASCGARVATGLPSTQKCPGLHGRGSQVAPGHTKPAGQKPEHAAIDCSTMLRSLPTSPGAQGLG